jgi:hypothetical protein
MDIGEVVKNEVFRPLTSVAIPGALAVAPYVILAQHYVPHVLDFWHDHDAAFSAMVVGCMLAAGLLLEDVGALLEVHIIDPLVQRKHEEHYENWRKYLQLKMKDEYVGQRYLRTVVTRLKFELSMLPALVVLWLGLVWIQVVYSTWTGWGFIALSAFVLGIALYLAIESYSSAWTLSKVRGWLIAACRLADASAARHEP